jgi:hypothetical protein
MAIEIEYWVTVKVELEVESDGDSLDVTYITVTDRAYKDGMLDPKKLCPLTQLTMKKYAEAYFKEHGKETKD